MEKQTFSLNWRSTQAASMLGAWGIGRQPFKLLFSKLSNGTETLNHASEQCPYKLALYECYRHWGRRGAQSFHQPVHSEAKENPGQVGARAGSEERQHQEGQKTAPGSCSENSVKFRKHERLQALRNEACIDLNKLVLTAEYSSLQMLTVQSQQWYNCYLEIWLKETLNTPSIALKTKNHLLRGTDFSIA